MSAEVREVVRAAASDAAAIADALGLRWRRQGREVVVGCPSPNHADRTPSCGLRRRDRGLLWHCMGCDVGGDVFDLVATVYGLDVTREFARVLELTAEIASVRIDNVTRTYTAPPIKPLPPEPPRLDDDVFDQVAQVVARVCPVDGQPDARAYLVRRGLYDVGRGTLAALPDDDAGYDRLIDAIVAAVGEDAWCRSGLATARGSFLFPAHRLVIFWRAPGVDGVVETVQRRLVRDRRPGERVGKYVFATGRPPRWPFGLECEEALGPGGEICFVEGALDTLAMRALAARHGVDRLTLGLPGTTWAQPWARLAAGRVAVVATDPNDAGDALAARLAPDLWAAGAADVRRAVPDAGACDWAELLERKEAAA